MHLGKQVERGLKRCILSLVARRNPARSGDTAVDLGSAHRVLLIRANVRLAHPMLITPAIAAVRQALPRACIEVLCDAAYGGLLAADPAVDGVVPIDRNVIRKPIALALLVRRLRSLRYDLVIECGRGGSFLGAALTGLSGGRQRVGSAEGRYGHFFNVRVPRRNRVDKVDPLLDLLASIGMPPVGFDLPEWRPTSEVVTRPTSPYSGSRSRRRH
jgi:ADP-heptose:LPS heptosyltransferase